MSLFGAWLAQTLGSLSSDGVVSEKSLIALDDVLKNSSALQRKAVLEDPERYLGTFERLSPHAQSSIRTAVARSDAHNAAAVDLGGFYLFVTRRLLAAHFYCKKNDSLPLSRQLAGLFGLLGFGFRKSGERLVQKWQAFRHVQKAKRAGKWDLAAVLIKSGVAIPDLAVCYATGLEQQPRLYACWQDTTRNILYASIVGIDFIPNAEGFWLIECNIGAGIDPLYDMDRFADGIAGYASKHGLQHLVVVNNETAGIKPQLIKQYEASAQSAGLSMRLIDRASCPRNLLGRRSAFPDDLKNDTLAARIVRHPTAVDYLMGDKTALLRAMRRYCVAGNDAAFLVPPYVADDQTARISHGNALPNFVYKLNDVDGGAGVVFIRAESLQHAKQLIGEESRDWRHADLKTRLVRCASTGGGEYQPFIASSLLHDRRLYKIRSHAIISPLGVDFLSANRVIGEQPMPKSVPHGILEDGRPFLVKCSGVESEVAVPDHEQDGMIAATLDVARAVQWAIANFFQTSDVRSPADSNRRASGG